MKSSRRRAGTVEHIETVKAETPTVTLKIECYHEETRIENAPGPAGSGPNPEKVTRTVKVVTHTAECKYPFTSCRDCSGTGYREWASHRMVKATLNQELVFADQRTRDDFLAFKTTFIARNLCDVSQSFTVHMHLSSYRPKALLERDPSERPWLVTLTGYCVACALLLSYPFRVWLTLVTHSRAFSYVKEIKVGGSNSGVAEAAAPPVVVMGTPVESLRHSQV